MSKYIKNNEFGKYLPNYITFLSLGFGLISIILSSQEYIFLAGSLIVVASILDTLDGYSARKLSLESYFGLQLDSLTDMVCFGVAPIVLISQYLHLQNRFTLWLLPVFLVYIWAGAFRLARFNLQPPKENSNGGSLGMAISAAGVILTLMILSDISQVNFSYPVFIMILLILLLSFLKISRVIFPPFSWFIPHPAFYVFYLILVVILTYVSSIFTAVWILWLCIVVASICRHLFLVVRQEKVIL
jgi:CDP-diacylglycerol--serine O-phosphatidyltransferase